MQVLLGKLDLFARQVRFILVFEQLQEVGDTFSLFRPELGDLGLALISQLRLLGRSLRIVGAQARLLDLVHVLRHRLVPLLLVERLWLQRLEHAKAIKVKFLRFLILA